MSLNKYLPFALIYFFINTVGLPFGLTYITLLAPLFYVWILLKRKNEVLLPFICILLPFMLVHLFVIRVEMEKYGIALFNILAVYIFGQAFYTWLKFDSRKEMIFKKILIINTFLCFIAIAIYFTPLNHIFWIRQNLTENVDQFLRLKMFTYEASYYAMLFVPVFLFYLMQYVLRQNTITGIWLLPMIFLPFVLSFSIGVIVCLIAAGVFTFMVHFRSLHRNRRIVNGFITGAFVAAALLVTAAVFFPGNPFFLRLQNILTGSDTSTVGRTAEAYELARSVLQENNPCWGIGPGQLNAVAADMIREYYLYYFTTPVAIPNASAETLALFGWVGFSLRLLLQVFLFFITRVWRNYFQLLLFFFVFLYQFMGSYITNGAEYVIWILAFTHAFPAFDVKRKTDQEMAPAQIISFSA